MMRKRKKKGQLVHYYCENDPELVVMVVMRPPSPRIPAAFPCRLSLCALDGSREKVRRRHNCLREVPNTLEMPKSLPPGCWCLDCLPQRIMSKKKKKKKKKKKRMTRCHLFGEQPGHYCENDPELEVMRPPFPKTPAAFPSRLSLCAFDGSSFWEKVGRPQSCRRREVPNTLEMPKSPPPGCWWMAC